MGKKKRKNIYDIISKSVSAMLKNEDIATITFSKDRNKIKVDSQKPSKKEIFGHFLDLNQKFNFYDIPPEDEFTVFKGKRNDPGIRKVLNAYKAISSLDKKLMVKKNELKSLIAKKKNTDQKRREIEKFKSNLDEAKKRFKGFSKEDKETASKITAIENYENSKKVYRAIFWFCKIVADHIEVNNDDKDSIAYEHADKIFTFFYRGDAKKPFRSFLDFIGKFNLISVDYPEQKVVHDIFSAISFPENGRLVTLAKWRGLIDKHGPSVMKFFSRADLIEKKLAEGLENLDHKGPENLKELKLANAKITYKRASENVEMARLFSEYNMGEQYFNEALEIDKKRKKSDNLPDVKINHRLFPGYWLVKMPIDDVRAYILGKITNCCQSIDGNARLCVIDGVTRKNNGFYVLLKQKTKPKKGEVEKPFKDGSIDYDSFDIVGQGYAWLSKKDNLVFDSWENLRPNTEDDEIAESLLGSAAEEIAKRKWSKISRVMIGQVTKSKFRLHSDYNKAKFPDMMKEGFQYPDSYNQYFIYSSIFLRLAERRVSDEMEKIYSGIPDLGESLYEGMEGFIGVRDAVIFLRFIKNMGKDIGGCFGTFLTKKVFASVVYSGLIELDNVHDIFSALAKIDDMGKLSVLVTVAAKEFYKDGWSRFNELKNLEAKKIERLISLDAQEVYRNGWATFDDLKGLNVDKIEWLVSWHARDSYKNGWLKFDDLKVLDVKRITELVYKDAREAYKGGWLNFSDLKDLDVESIEWLISWHAREAYKGGWLSFADLKELDVEKIKVLVSENAREAYKGGWLSFDDLKELGVEKIKVLVSEGAREAYKGGWLSFDDLKKLDVEMLEILISHRARDAYSRKWTTFNKLKELSIKKIDKLINYVGFFSFDDLSKLYDEDLGRFDKLAWLTSRAEELEVGFDDVSNLYDNNQDKFKAIFFADVGDSGYKSGAKFKELSKLYDDDPEKFKVLFSSDAKRAYDAGASFKVLSTWYDDDPEKLKTIILSRLSRLGEIIDSSYIDFSAKGVLSLYEESIDKFKDFTSPGVIRAYRLGIGLDILLQLYNEGKDKFNLLISDGAMNLYGHDVSDSDEEDLVEDLLSDEGYWGEEDMPSISIDTFRHIKDVEKIKKLILLGNSVEDNKNNRIVIALASQGAAKAYHKGWIQFDDLKDLEFEKIEALISESALKSYERGWKKFDDLKSLDAKKIEVLVSYDVEKACKSGLVNFDALKNVTSSKIKLLTSERALEAYKNKWMEFDDLKDLSSRKIRFFFSGDLVNVLKDHHGLFNDLKDMDDGFVESFASERVLNACQEGWVKFSDLKGLSAETISELFPYGCCMQEIYSSGTKFKDWLKLYNDNPDKFKALTQCGIRYIYDGAGVRFNYLSKLYDEDPSKFKAFDSIYIKTAYENGWLTFDDLVDLDNKGFEFSDIFDAYVGREEKELVTDMVASVSHTVSRVLFGKGVIEQDQKEKILGDIKSVFKTFRRELYNASILRKDFAKHPLIMYIAASYLPYCMVDRDTFFGGKIEFAKDFASKKFSEDLEDVIKRYDAFSKEEVDVIAKLATYISDGIKEKLSSKAISFNYVDVMVLSDLIDRCSKKEGVEKRLSEILASDEKKDELVGYYLNAFKKFKNLQSIKNDLSGEVKIDGVLGHKEDLKTKI